MRAGANEFLTFPPAADAFEEALRRTAARRSTTNGSDATTLVFFGAKGGAGATTIAVNCGVEIARLSKRRTIILDLKPGLGEVSLFLGVRSRYTLLDALDNIHRLDAGFLRELVVKHKSGLDLLAGSDQFDRPGAADSGGLEEVFRLLADEYDYILIDAGSQVNAASIPALYTADFIGLVANPDVPSIRNAQRLLERIRQLGASAERVRLLLNRAAEPYPIPPTQIEAGRRPSDRSLVPERLQDGVDGDELRRAARAQQQYRACRAVRPVYAAHSRRRRRDPRRDAGQEERARSQPARIDLVSHYEFCCDTSLFDTASAGSGGEDAATAPAVPRAACQRASQASEPPQPRGAGTERSRPRRG
jgi:MinD-like ATPase involved in chromosome partitioning or flagellar assembly